MPRSQYERTRRKTTFSCLQPWLKCRSCPDLPNGEEAGMSSPFMCTCSRCANVQQRNEKFSRWLTHLSPPDPLWGKKLPLARIVVKQLLLPELLAELSDTCSNCPDSNRSAILVEALVVAHLCPGSESQLSAGFSRHLTPPTQPGQFPSAQSVSARAPSSQAELLCSGLTLMLERSSGKEEQSSDPHLQLSPSTEEGEQSLPAPKVSHPDRTPVSDCCDAHLQGKEGKPSG